MADARGLKRTIKEYGIVISKECKEASSEWEKDGKIIPAQPERFIVKVASGEEIQELNGITNVNIMEYRVSKEEFKNFKYLSPIVATYEFSTYGVKAISLALAK